MTIETTQSTPVGVFGDVARERLLDRAMELTWGGYSLLPFTINSDGRKRPTIGSIAEYRERQPTDEELFDWLEDPRTTCIGIVTGPVSGGFIALDFDNHRFFNELWAPYAREIVRSFPAAKKLVVETTRKGVHVGWRTSPASQLVYKRQILAAYVSVREPTITTTNGQVRPNVKVGIELLAGGQACIVSPSDNGAYVPTKGDLMDIPVLDDEVTTLLIDLARACDRLPPEIAREQAERAASRAASAGSMGSEPRADSIIALWNSQVSIHDVLERNGYRRWKNSNSEYVRPDGNHPSLMVAIGSGGYERVKALNSTDPLHTAIGDGAHDSFSAFAVLECNGDQREAARRARDYLTPAVPAPAPPSRAAVIATRPPRRPGQ